MSKKLYAALLPILAVVAFASMSGAAQAAPHWFICEKHAGAGTKFSDSECQKALAAGEWEWVKAKETPKTQVVTFGKLKLVAPTLTLECKVLDGGNIWNTEAGGLDEILAFTNYECKATPAEGCPAPEIRSKGFPWSTKLVAGTPNKDQITGISVTVFCGGVEGPTFTGKLEPTISNPTEAHPLQFTFTASTGELENAAKEKAKVEGTDSLITEADQQVKVE